MASAEHLVTHPDENVLAAFAEHSLTARERESVLEHLSTCARCRDVVFLAQEAFSETEHQSSVTAPPPVPRHRQGLSWGILGAAGVLAALLVAVPVAMYRQRSRPVQQAALPAPERQVTAPPPASAPRKAIEAPPPTAQPHPAQRSAGGNASAKKTSGSGNGEVAGSVADASGAAVPGANVSVRALPNGTSHTAVTDAKGQFNVASLPSGDYQVEVQAPGFHLFTDSITVQPSKRANLEAKLNPGAATETVTVSAASAVPQPVTPEVHNGVIGGLVSSNRTSLTPRDTKPPSSRPSPASAAAPTSQGGPKPKPIELGQIINGATPSAAVLADSAALLLTFSVKDGLVLWCMGDHCVTRPLPGGAKAVSAAGEGQMVMAVDSAGNLFLSSDTGEHWQPAKIQWSGKAVRVGLQPVRDQAAYSVGSAAVNGALGAAKTPAPTVLPPFDLTNDKGQVWVSSDGGNTWMARSSTAPTAPTLPPP